MNWIRKLKAEIRRINWRKGSSSVMMFYSFLVCVTIMCMVILQYTHVYSATEHTQMLADVTADAVTVGADNGWMVVYSGKKDSAVDIKKKIMTANTKKGSSSCLISEEEVPAVKLKSGKKASSGMKQAVYDGMENAIDVIVTSVTDSVTTLIDTSYKAVREAMSRSTVATGGLRIALYAYSFSIQAEENGKLNKAVKTHTRYIWGAGRGGQNDWQDYTDCSGYVAGVYNHFTDDSGKPYSFTAYTGSLQDVGTTVYSGSSSGCDYSKLQPGDIICYWWESSSGNGGSDHVGIYFGEGYQLDCVGGSKNLTPETAGPGVTFRKVPSAPYIRVQRVVKKSGVQSKDKPKALKKSEEGIEAGKRIYSALIGLGFTAAQAAGAIGCMSCESGDGSSFNFAPYIVQGQSRSWSKQYTKAVDSGKISREQFIWDSTGGGGYGIAQWTGITDAGVIAAPARKALLYDTAKMLGVSIGSTEAAIATISRELSGNAIATVPSYNGHQGFTANCDYSGCAARMMACNNAADAAECWARNYEQCVDKTLPTRRNNGTIWYSKYS